MHIARLREAAHRNRLQVAIDGPAGAGKSTIGRRLAGKLGSAYLDTGLMYRAVTWLALQRGVSPGDAAALAAIARDTEFDSGLDASSLLVNGELRDQDLRSAEVDRTVSEVSAHADVRQVLVDEQRRLANDKCIVMVGRDIGTTVLPGSPVKLWVTASPEERARRRLTEGLAGSAKLDVAHMADLIQVRDDLDSSRRVSPLHRAPDAVVLNTDSANEEQVLEAAMNVVGIVLEQLEQLQPHQN